jgi:hypothetical protein
MKLKSLKGPVAGLGTSLLFLGGFLLLLHIFAPLTTPANALAILRAIVDVAAVILGFSGIMFANTLSVIGQAISEARRDAAKGGPTTMLETLQQSRRTALNSLLFVYIILILCILSSLAMMTYVIEVPISGGYAMVGTIWSLGIPVYWLVAGMVLIPVALRMQET